MIKFYPFVLVGRFKNILKDKIESNLIVDKNSFNAIWISVTKDSVTKLSFKGQQKIM